MAVCEIKGTVESISKEVSANKAGTFMCKFLVIHEPNATDSRFDDYHRIQVSTDRYALVDKFKVGSKVDVTVNVESRKWESPAKGLMYFTTLKLWKIALIGAETQGHTTRKAEDVGFASEEEDIPF